MWRSLFGKKRPFYNLTIILIYIPFQDINTYLALNADKSGAVSAAQVGALERIAAARSSLVHDRLPGLAHALLLVHVVDAGVHALEHVIGELVEAAEWQDAERLEYLLALQRLDYAVDLDALVLDERRLRFVRLLRLDVVLVLFSSNIRSTTRLTSDISHQKLIINEYIHRTEV